jgi:hypothetical protein
MLVESKKYYLLSETMEQKLCQNLSSLLVKMQVESEKGRKAG